MKLVKFFTSKLFLIQVGIAIGISIAIIWITLLSLRWYTHHGEKLKVPDLYGMSITKADAKIKAEQLRHTIYDSIYDSNYAPGTVLDQRPLAGAIVKRDRNLFLTINSIKPEQVRFPDLIDNSFRQAYEILISNGFKLGKLEYAENQFFNLVLFPKYKGDTIHAGSMINKGSTINLVLGRGANSGIIAPNVLGKSAAQAKEKIILSNMNLGKIQFDGTITNHLDSLQAKVWKQSPTFNENFKIKAGSSITIWLTRDSILLKQTNSMLQKRLSNSLY